MPLSLCVVGCGGYARQVLERVRDMTDEFTPFFASRDEAKAREFCEEFGGAGFFGSYEAAAATLVSRQCTLSHPTTCTWRTPFWPPVTPNTS